MNSSSSAKDSPHRRRRKFSWTYDDDHHIGQYSDENTLLPINETFYSSENEKENSNDFDGDDCETDQEMELCEPHAVNQQQNSQPQQPLDRHQNSGIGRRRRRQALGKAWDIPSPAVMQRRNRFRQIVDDETRRHRRIHPRSNSNSNNTESQTNEATIEPNPPNILNLLKDREVFGSSGIRSVRRTTDELRTYSEQACVTKFESSYLSHLQHDEEEGEQQEAASNQTSGDSSGNNNNNNSNSNNGVSNANAQSNGGNTNSSSRPQNINNSNASSKAVSTISIAFSPDGKTMASTHGDHTVKITCCITGRLLQTLVGHPRTPWTVKYHPHAGADLKNPKTKKAVIANRTANTNINNNTASQEDSSQQQLEQEGYDQQQIVASGCLGHQVRIWDWVTGTCLQMIRLDFAIISLSFHPAGNVLAIANGTRLHFWGLPTVNTKAEDQNESEITNDSQSRRGMHIEMRHMLRCVHFLPDGKRVIVGGVNPQTQAEIRRQRRLAAEGNQERVPTMSFYLRLWDFDLEAARGPPSVSRQAQVRQGTAPSATQNTDDSSTTSNQTNTTTASSITTASGLVTQQQAIIERSQAAAAAAAALGTTTRRRRAISNPRCFVPRALLYNDGGFDVSPDGKTLCACAEYWLPEGVNNATDLLHPPEKDDYYGDFDYDSSSDDSSSSSDDESESPGGDKEENDVKMDDANDEAKKSQNSEESKANENVLDRAEVSGSAAVVGAKEDITSTEKATKESKRDASNSSPPRHLASSSSQTSATPPRIIGGQPQPQNIASPPLAVGTTSTAYGVPMPPMQGGMSAQTPPQTPPPNVNPLNFPLSPPSPPGRRFAGGLKRGAQPQSQQHEQLLQQYNRQQAMLNQHRLNQQQQGMPPPQQQRVGSVSTPPSRGTESASTTIPAPPRINHRNNRQHRLHTQHPGSTIQKAGNPFGNTSRHNRGGVSPHTQRGRYVPHVVTISLDTEPYVETTTEEVLVGHAGPNISSNDAATASGRIRTTTVAETSSNGGIANTTIVTKTTYNIPGRGAAFGATRPHVLERRPRLGQLLSACPLDTAKASAVTCVKFSPCTDFCLIGYGVREPHVEETNGDSNDPPGHPPYHPVTAMYKVNRAVT
mmetsp:Transcript_20565/g.51145  ORF Transcript_20565/g.51145 Transcript_20565/m.51145 type:complete len:1114 (-) Transcript_20565:4-3345(-)